MKFWLNRDTNYIYLDQLIKAAGILDDYKKIIPDIKDGKILVNNEPAFQRRKMIYEGDEIRYKGQFIKIVGSKEAERLKRVKEEPEGRIKHGRTVHTWAPKELKKDDRKKIKVGIISIGNEILLGKTINTNLAYIGSEFSKIGLYINQEKTIRDDKEDILRTLDEFWSFCNIVVTTGGLGPTIDDITKQTIAEYFDKELIFHEDIWTNVKNRFTKRNLSTPEINRNQALVPEGFENFFNDFGTAPGLFYKQDNKYFFSLPGVPVEMKYLIDNHIVPKLKKDLNLLPIKIKTIHTAGITESLLAEKLANIDIPAEVNFAFLPQLGRVDLRIYGCSKTDVKKVEDQIVEIVREYIWGYDTDSLNGNLHNILINKKLTLSFAESCTGGLLQKMMTDFAGSSSYFKGGVVTYSNEIKESILKVKNQTLSQFGAVSKETAIEMVHGVSNLFDSDISASVTGIAGPEGGTFEKPVGTVHTAYLINGVTYHQLLNLTGDRETIRVKTAERVLSFILNKIT